MVGAHSETGMELIGVNLAGMGLDFEVDLVGMDLGGVDLGGVDLGVVD